MENANKDKILQWHAKELAKAGFVVVPKDAIIDLQIQTMISDDVLARANYIDVMALEKQRMFEALADELIRHPSAVKWVETPDDILLAKILRGTLRLILVGVHDAALRDLRGHPPSPVSSRLVGGGDQDTAPRADADTSIDEGTRVKENSPTRT